MASLPILKIKKEEDHTRVYLDSGLVVTIALLVFGFALIIAVGGN